MSHLLITFVNPEIAKESFKNIKTPERATEICKSRGLKKIQSAVWTNKRTGQTRKIV